MQQTLDDVRFKVTRRSTLGWAGDDTAQLLMNKVIERAEILMRRHRWPVVRVEEFFPRSDNLLGMNTNRGELIQLRLRPPIRNEEKAQLIQRHNNSIAATRPASSNASWSAAYPASPSAALIAKCPTTASSVTVAKITPRFYSFEHVMCTMLHELVHCVIGPHNASFWKRYHELVAECELLELDVRRSEVMRPPPPPPPPPFTACGQPSRFGSGGGSGRLLGTAGPQSGDMFGSLSSSPRVSASGSAAFGNGGGGGGRKLGGKWGGGEGESSGRGSSSLSVAEQVRVAALGRVSLLARVLYGEGGETGAGGPCELACASARNSGAYAGVGGGDADGRRVQGESSNWRDDDENDEQIMQRLANPDAASSRDSADADDAAFEMMLREALLRSNDPSHDVVVKRGGGENNFELQQRPMTFSTEVIFEDDDELLRRGVALSLLENDGTAAEDNSAALASNVCGNVTAGPNDACDPSVPRAMVKRSRSEQQPLSPTPTTTTVSSLPPLARPPSASSASLFPLTSPLVMNAPTLPSIHTPRTNQSPTSARSYGAAADNLRVAAEVKDGLLSPLAAFAPTASPRVQTVASLPPLTAAPPVSGGGKSYNRLGGAVSVVPTSPREPQQQNSGSWACHACTFVNASPHAPLCAVCSTMRRDDATGDDANTANRQCTRPTPPNAPPQGMFLPAIQQSASSNSGVRVANPTTTYAPAAFTSSSSSAPTRGPTSAAPRFWQCHRCTYATNGLSEQRCAMCGSSKVLPI